jgi:signal transduction histidine kinase
VIANLLTNAAKYTEPGGTVEVFSERDGDHVVLKVRDDGIGMPAELVPRVFDLFVQGDRTVDRAQGGLGLGLAIVNNLVAMHDGTVSAASEFGPTVAVLDLGLPVMDGYELARRLRALFRGKIRLVAVTGYGQDRDRERSKRAGFVEHLVKPVELEALVEQMVAPC